MTCPKCQAEMTDFRAEKASGAKPAKFPDFKCEACGHPKWTTPKPKPAPTAPRPTALGFTERPPKWTWPTLSETYLQSLLIARKQVVAMATALNHEYMIADILSAAATIFIAASRDGVKLIAQSREPDPDGEPVGAYDDPR